MCADFPADDGASSVLVTKGRKKKKKKRDKKRKKMVKKKMEEMQKMQEMIKNKKAKQIRPKNELAPLPPGWQELKSVSTLSLFVSTVIDTVLCLNRSRTVAACTTTTRLNN